MSGYSWNATLAGGLVAAALLCAIPPGPGLAQTANAGAQAASLRTMQLAPKISVAVPKAWTAIQDTRSTYLVEHRTKGKLDASMVVSVEARASHAEAVDRLVQLRSAFGPAAAGVTIAGWPAVEFKELEPFQHPGEAAVTRYGPDVRTYHVTVAIAAGETLVRFDTLLQPGAVADLADAALAISRATTAPAADPAQSEADLRRVLDVKSAATAIQPASFATGTPAKPHASGSSPMGGGGAVKVAGGGEIEAASSLNGATMVTDAACAISYWNGSAFANSTVSWTGVPPGLDGDCSVAWAPSGNFYLARLGPSGYVALGQSTNNGQTFNYVTTAVNRTTNVDQPHITADRYNLSASSADVLYISWQETGSFVSRVACSSTGSGTWNTPIAASSGSFGYPRVSVGRDGMVYVASRTWPNAIDLDKFSSCDTGMVEQPGFPVTFPISDLYGQDCASGAIAGLDRCNDGNTLASPTIAVDDTDPGHVYLGWAQANTALNGQDIMVVDFRVAGGSVVFGTPVAANAAFSAIRFMPWLGTWGGTAYVGWYDRRFAGTTVADPDDFTRYFFGSVSAANGVLAPGPETDLMGVDDPQCASGWPNGTREPQDATACTVQPQNASSGSGSPKYGDYNGLAIGGGELLNIWASGTAPADLPAASSHAIRAYVALTDLPSDFFVRDWTTNATSHDTGVEPSTNPVFYETSDVWNQTSSTPEPFVNDWVVGDQPVRGAPNFAFARVSRRAPASATSGSTTVSVQFFLADFGLGVPFQNLGTQSVTLAPGNLTEVTSGLTWSVPASSSTHICIASQISAPGDPFISPSLLGGSPGPSGADPSVLADNNKAQRNLAVVSGGGAGGEFHAIIHNLGDEAREMVLAYSFDEDTAKFVDGGAIEVIGGETYGLKGEGRVRLPRMAAGEDRWVRVRFANADAPLNRLLAVRVAEIGPHGPVNGFTIGFVRKPLAEVLRDRLTEEADILDRLAAIDGKPIAGREAQETRRLLTAPEVNFERARALLSRHTPYLRQASTSAIARAGGDPFGLTEALAGVDKALRGKDEETVLLTLDQSVQRLDALLTQVQRGTRARSSGG